MLEHGMLRTSGAITYSPKTDIFGDGSGVAFYRLDGNANDESGNYHGTETGAAVYGGGAFERGVVSSNTNTNFITTANIPSGSIKTVSLWINPTALPTDATFHVIYMNTTATANANGLLIRYVSAGLYALEVYINISGTRYYTTTNPQTTISLNSWTNLVICLETNNTISVYKNGVSIVTSTPTTSGAVTYNGSLMFGQYNPNGSNNQYTLIGSIDQVRIFNRAITATEVAILYAEVEPTSIVDNINPFLDGSLKALYQFNGNATDLTGVYNGTATNVTYGTGKFGQCAVFNGTSSKVDISYIPNNLVSIALVFKDNSVATAKCVFNYLASNLNNAGGLSLNTYLSQLRINVSGASGWVLNAQSGVTLINGVTYHVVLVLNNTFIIIYLDGKEIYRSGAIVPKLATATVFNIGHSVNTEYYNGSIDQFRIFNKALTPLEVASLYNETTPLEEPMHSLVDPFKDGSGKALYRLDGNALDESGNYNGTATSVTYGNAIVGRAAVFNGSTSYIGCNTMYATSMSYSMFVKVNTVSVTQGIFGEVASTGELNTVGVSLKISATNTFDIVLGNRTSTPVLSNSTIATGMVTGTFYHIVLTINGTTVKIYRDGVLLGTLAASGNISTTTINGNFSIGRPGAYNGQYLNGSADQLRIFNRALTQTEITALHINQA